MHKLFFCGIAGTGMASLAGLCQEAGFQVRGSDHEIYPPMSDLLASCGIEVFTPYSAETIRRVSRETDLFILGNILSRNHPEVEAILQSKKPYQSFPEFLGQTFLKHRIPLVITGTHGKTTTASLLAHILTVLGEDPGFFIGGQPLNFSKSFHLGSGPLFVVEGDEYDTAFFDKGSKFLHYHPRLITLTHVEFDHADIFQNLDQIVVAFQKLLHLLPHSGNCVANTDDPGVSQVLKGMGWNSAHVSSFSKKASPVSLKHAAPQDGTLRRWQMAYDTDLWGEVVLSTELQGEHNAVNLGMVLRTLHTLWDRGWLMRPVLKEALVASVASFQGVKKRMNWLGEIRGVQVYEDFAHHPTAVRQVIQGFRKTFPHRRLVIAFDPKNATSRRSVFTQEYIRSFSEADVTLLGPSAPDARIPEAERMDLQVLAQGISSVGMAMHDHEQLLQWLREQATPSDSVLFLSSGPFGGLPQKFLHS